MSTTTQHAAAGDIIYSPFTKKSRVYIIKSGYVLAFTYDDSGKRRIHLVYGPGAYFPVLTVFHDKPQRATYEALTQVELEVCAKKEFLACIENNHEFCRQILDRTVDQLGIFADRVVELQATRLEERLLLRLKMLTKEHGVSSEGGVHLPYKLKHHHLADMLGVERESVTRALNRLKLNGDILITSDDSFAIVRE